jgi:hypothetical protein
MTGRPSSRGRPPRLIFVLSHERAKDLISTLKAIGQALRNTLPLRELSEAEHDDGSPFYPPAYFLSHFNISPESLRKAKERGDIRTIRPRHKVARYHYSEPDARQLWPHCFVVAPKATVTKRDGA